MLSFAALGKMHNSIWKQKRRKKQSCVVGRVLCHSIRSVRGSVCVCVYVYEQHNDVRVYFRETTSLCILQMVFININTRNYVSAMCMDEYMYSYVQCTKYAPMVRGCQIAEVFFSFT